MNQSTLANMTIEPELLFFKKCDEFLEPVYLKLKNNTAHQLAWKVKMTSPKRYKMEPKRGVVPALETAEVRVKMRYLKYPPNMPGNDKRERDSNGVYVDRFQFEFVTLGGETVSAANMRDKPWWAKQFKLSDVSMFKSKVFFTLNETFPQRDIDALFEQLATPHTHGFGDHSLIASGFLETSCFLDRSQTEQIDNKSILNINTQPVQEETKTIEPIQPSPLTQIEQPVIPEAKKIEQPEVVESKPQTPLISTPNSPVQTTEKNSTPQIPQQPILRPPEKPVNTSQNNNNNNSPQNNNNNSPRKTLSSNTVSERTTSTTQPSENSTQPPIKELTRKTTQKPAQLIQADIPVPQLICGHLKTLVWNNLVIILAFLLGYLVRWYFPF